MKVFFPLVHRFGLRVLVIVVAVSAGLAGSSAGQTASSQQLRCNPCSLAFGSVRVGASKTMSLTLRNSGTTTLKLTRFNKSGAGFRIAGPVLPLVMQPSKSVALSIVFSPGSQGTFAGKVWVENNRAPIGLLVQLTGAGTSGTAALTPNPRTVDFGTVPVGSTATEYATIKNTGGSSVRLTSSSVTGTGFSHAGLNLPLTLNAGQSITFTAKFKPAATGSASGRVSVSSAAGTVVVNLTGSGAGSGSLSATPATLSFGTVTVGSTKRLTGTLKANGAALKVTSGTTSSAEFTLSGVSFPLNLANGQTATYSVTFRPGASGAATANLTFRTATGASASEALTGSGAAAGSHSVALTWNASSSGAVIGYNIYRGTVAGGPYSKINTSIESSTAFSDTAVSGGKTYYYVVTSVDGGGNESGYSSQVKAIIPSP